MNPPSGRTRPSPADIIWTDWPALFASLMVPGIGLIGLLVSAGRLDQVTLLTVTLPVTIVSLALLFWRIRRVRNLFRYGTAVPGAVMEVRIVRDRGRLEFLYEWENQTHGGWMPVHKNRRVVALRPGQAVTVLVDPANPRKAVVEEAFAGKTEGVR